VQALRGKELCTAEIGTKNRQIVPKKAAGLKREERGEKNAPECEKSAGNGEDIKVKRADSKFSVPKRDGTGGTKTRVGRNGSPQIGTTVEHDPVNPEIRGKCEGQQT